MYLFIVLRHCPHNLRLNKWSLLIRLLPLSWTLLEVLCWSFPTTPWLFTLSSQPLILLSVKSQVCLVTWIRCTTGMIIRPGCLSIESITENQLSTRHTDILQKVRWLICIIHCPSSSLVEFRNGTCLLHHGLSLEVKVWRISSWLKIN